MQMSEPYSGQNTNDADLMEVLMALKQNIMRDLHVGAFAIVKKVNPVRLQFIPQVNGEEDKLIEAENLAGTLALNDIVYVSFADRNFISALKRLKSKQKPSTLQNETDLHSEKYAVIIAKLNMEEE